MDDLVPSTGKLKPSRWPLYTALVGIPVLGVVAFLVLGGRLGADVEARQVKAWSALERCLVGEPFRQGERPSLRVRRIQLAAIGKNWIAASEEAWPGRCATYAHALHEALRDAGKEHKDTQDLAFYAEHLGKALKDSPYPNRDLSEIVDPLWDLAGKESYAAVESSEVKLPPLPADPLTLDALHDATPLSREVFALRSLSADRVPFEALHLLVTDKSVPSSPLLCTFEAAVPVARCTPVARSIAAVSRELALLGAADTGAEPLVFAAPAGEGGIFRATSGDRIDEMPSYGGFVTKDGLVSAFGYDRKASKFKLTRWRAGAPPRESRFALKDVVNDSQVAELWDTVVWVADGELMVERVEDGDAATTPAFSAGPVTDVYPEGETLLGCKSAEALSILVRSTEGDFVAMDTGNRWHPPHQLATSGPAELTCREKEATVTRSDAEVAAGGFVEGSIAQERCTPGGCQAGTVELADFFHEVKDVMSVRGQSLGAADLGGKLLVVWQAGRLGGVRMRLAPIEKIAAAEDTVVFDDLVRDGRVGTESVVEEIALYVRPRFAVLLISTVTGVYAFGIDEGGKVTPIKVEG